MSHAEGDAVILTLEPFLDAVREGVEARGWTLSGLQKTTSHEFEGRWEGHSTRSAYVFFHHPEREESVEAYLDETSDGLRGNLALVLEGPSLRELGDPRAALESLRAAAEHHLPERYRTPLTVRLRLRDADAALQEADVQFRVKLKIPIRALEAGAPAVTSLASATVGCFEDLLAHPTLAPLRLSD